jgi:hypothetical protein
VGNEVTETVVRAACANDAIPMEENPTITSGLGYPVESGEVISERIIFETYLLTPLSYDIPNQVPHIAETFLLSLAHPRSSWRSGFGQGLSPALSSGGTRRNARRSEGLRA